MSFATLLPAPAGLKRGGALVLSLLAHVAVAAAVVHGQGSAAVIISDTREHPLEIAAPEIATVPPAEPPMTAAAVTAGETVRVRVPVAPSHSPSRIATAESTRESEQPPPVVSAPAVAAHFVMSAPISAPVATTAQLGLPRTAAPSASTPGSAPLTEHEVDVGPRLLAGPPPTYPAQAEAAGVESSVPVELVIDARGAVQSAVALGRVGYGLDEAALAAVRAYRFAPARRNGMPVAVRMRWVVRFELR